MLHRNIYFIALLLCAVHTSSRAQVPFDPGDFTDKPQVIKSNNVQKRTGYLFPDSTTVLRTQLQQNIQLNDSLLYSETFYSQEGYRTREIIYGLNGKPEIELNYNERLQLTSKIVYNVNDTLLFGYIFLYEWKRKRCDKAELYYGFTRHSELDSILTGKTNRRAFSSHEYLYDNSGHIIRAIPAEGSADTTSLFFHYNKYKELTGVYGNDINHWMISFEYSDSGFLQRYSGNGNPGLSYLDDFSFYYQDGLLVRCEISGEGMVKYYYTPY